MMGGRDRERFVKLLHMTSSASDGEALSAIRKCNDVLVQHKLSWRDVVAGRCLAPERRAAGAGAASASRAFAASLRREVYVEQACREERAAALRTRIRNVPLVLRLLLFPLWAGAAMLAGLVTPETSASLRVLKSCAVVLVAAACCAVWIAIFDLVATLI